MRNTLLATAIAVGLLALNGTAHAQMAVFDSANFANTLQTMQTAFNQLTQLQNQLQTMRQQYQMFTNPSNIVGMLPNLNTSFLQNSMPAASSLPGQVFGSLGSMTPNAQTFYNLNHVFTATGTDPQAAYLNRSAISTANIQGIAATNLQSIEARQAELNQMQLDLQNASDIKQVDAINGRIAIESNAIQGQQAQATNLVALANAQTQADQEAQLQAARQGHEQAAAQFTGTLN